MRKRGNTDPNRDENKHKSYEGYAKRCAMLGWIPCEPRVLKAPDGQRWAVNYLRYECSNYRIYRQMQMEAWELPIPGKFVIYERIHQIVKNRVLAEIAARYPELAEAAEEQTI